jgi:glutamine amidotransferase
MIVIVDYKMGNLGSISNIIKKIGHQSIITSDSSIISSADKIILPGVGHFEKAMQNLSDLNLIEVLTDKALNQQTPILGICLGMQLLTSFSEEGNVKGLNWINAKTEKFKLDEFPELKIPHMGWNEIFIPKQQSICENLDDQSRFYFVHSYHVVCENNENILMTTKYGNDFTSAIIKDNIIGVQFHPEKSHKFGMQLFKNFIEKC